jgi:ribosomal protein S18 acetylase RimI-like enzyme
MPLTGQTSLPKGIALRAAHRADAEAIVSVHTRAVRISAASHYSEDEIDTWVSRMTVATCVEAMQSRSMLVAVAREAESRVVGFGQLHPQEGVVEAIYIEPDYERRGIGRALAQALEAVAQKCDLRWLVADASLNAVPFYLALGFRQVALDRHEPAPGIHIACAVMEKDLARSALAR